jgi:hypothetical protein
MPRDVNVPLDIGLAALGKVSPTHRTMISVAVVPERYSKVLKLSV